MLKPVVGKLHVQRYAGKSHNTDINEWLKRPAFIEAENTEEDSDTNTNTDTVY